MIACDISEGDAKHHTTKHSSSSSSSSSSSQKLIMIWWSGGPLSHFVEIHYFQSEKGQL